jgi:gliding motility-associated-like protein
MNFRITLLIAISLGAVVSSFSQINISVQAQPSTCSSNGSIQVTATGGTGTLNYELTSTCLASPIVQQLSSFNNLPPCQYTVVVTDGSTGASASETVTIGGNYQSPDISLFCGSCQIDASTNGGLAPFTYAISSQGLIGPFTNNTPATNPVFDNISSGENYWVKVTDACGNVSVETCQSGEGSITDFTWEVGLDGNIHVLSVTGGTGPLVYELNSTAGMFSNTSGVFLPNQWGCNMTLTVRDGCAIFTKEIRPKPVIKSICTNFADGTATLEEVIGGIPPYELNYVSPTGLVTSTTSNVLDGLPINAGHYLFQVVDACGNVSSGIFKQKKYPVFQQEPLAECDGTSISIFTPSRECNGGFDSDSWPFEVICLSCSPTITKTIDSADVSVVFNGSQPGTWVFDLSDGCEDEMLCKDSVILHLEKFCNSVEAKLIDRFICDNGSVSDRYLSMENGLFTLLDENDNVLSTNNTGIFQIPDSGYYKVTLFMPNCGTFEAAENIGFWAPVDPVMSTYISNSVINGVCRTAYQLVIDPKTGPFTLTGGPDNISIEIGDASLTNTCLQLSVSLLLPGDYQLIENDHCGFKQLHLPAPDNNLQAIPFGNCPGSGTITVSGTQTLDQWKDWATANDAKIDWPGSLIDNYSLDTDSKGALTQQTGSPYTFVNVEAGAHTVYLYTLNSQCPVDTVTVIVPEADVLAMTTSTGVLCDGAGTTSLEFEMLSGKPPYTIEQVNCNDPNQVLATYNVIDNFLSLPGYGTGDYCFRLVDSCITSLDRQFSVQYFQDDIELAFNCDNTLSLSVDSLNASYEWVDEEGNVVGNSQKLNVPNPNIETSFTVKVDIGECIIERSITVPATEIIPLVQIEGAQYFCEGDSVALSLATNANNYAWSNGASSQSITVSQSGIYSATVTNGYGCAATTAFEVTMDIPELDLQILSGGSGFGLNCFQDSNGIITANPTVGVGPFSFQWSTMETSQTITNLKTGNFSVTMTDAIGCVDSANILLTEPDLFVPSLDFTDPKCFGVDDAIIEVLSWTGGAGGVKVSLDGSLPQFAPVTIDYLPPGEYNINISDANGCTVNSMVNIVAPQQHFMELGDDFTLQLGDSTQLMPQVSFEPVDSFQWKTNDPGLISELEPWVQPVGTAFYALTVWDKNGCPLEDKLTIVVNKELDVYAPTAFSPNGDGNNDRFTIYARKSAVRTIKRMQLFDRYGEKVFEQIAFNPNDEPMGWNGAFDGQPMNPGVFVWKAEIEFIDGRVEVLYGDVTLVR